MSRTYNLYLHDILRAIERISLVLRDLDEATFKSNDVRVDGILFNLMTIGEAVKNIPDEVRDQVPELPWRNIGRFRDKVVHHYFSIDLDVVWEVVTIHLPALKIAVENLLEKDTEDGEE